VSYLIRTLACTYFGGHHIEPHVHPWGQLIYAATGVMRIRAAGRLWLVPPARAVWAPAGLEHEIWARGDFAMRTLYIAPSLAAALPGACLGLDVPPLLRELIVHIVGLGTLREGDKDHEALAQVTVGLLKAPSPLPSSLPWPRDRRALAVAERLLADPAATAELSALGRGAGASGRTLQRLFLDETGLGFSEWRQRLRLLHAATLLGAGASVTEAGLEAGYASTSAFIAAFRKQLGRTPARMRSAGP
jgi:AraC-like DNA-binding protein